MRLVRENSAKHSAGVTVSATTSEARLARMKAIPSGAKNRPCKSAHGQHRHKTMRHHKGGVDHGSSALPAWLRAPPGKTFGAGPDDRPVRPIFPQPPQDVLHSDDGIIHHHAQHRGQAAQRHRVQRHPETIQHHHGRQQATMEWPVKATSAVRKSSRNRINTTATSTAPSNNDRFIFLMAISMNVAGRCRRRSVLDAFRRKNRFQFFQRLFHRPRHLHRIGAVLAGGGHQHARLAIDQRVAKFRLRCPPPRWPHLSAGCFGPRADVTTTSPNCRRRERLAFGLQNQSLRRRLNKARPAHAGGRAGRRRHVLHGKPNASSRSGRSWICNCRTSPPKTFAAATPGTDNNRGRTVQSANVRSSIGERWSDVRPNLSRSIVDEVNGSMGCGSHRRAVRLPFAPAAPTTSAGRYKCPCLP